MVSHSSNSCRKRLCLSNFCESPLPHEPLEGYGPAEGPTKIHTGTCFFYSSDVHLPSLGSCRCTFGCHCCAYCTFNTASRSACFMPAAAALLPGLLRRLTYCTCRFYPPVCRTSFSSLPSAPLAPPTPDINYIRYAAFSAAVMANSRYESKYLCVK